MIKNNKLKFACFLTIILSCNFINSQESLLDEIDYNNEDYKISVSAFKANKVINGQSTKQSGKKELYLYVAHRFGSIKSGIKTLFGLDIANTKIELLYGLSNNLQIGFSRVKRFFRRNSIGKSQGIERTHHLGLWICRKPCKVL